MDRNMMNRYKTIYKTQVLPTKTMSKNTQKTYDETVKLFDEFSPYIKRANEVVLGCGSNDKEK